MIVLPRVGVAGLSHLGLVSAAALASRGLAVTAFDPDVALVERITSGHLPVLEPGLPELLEKRERPVFTAVASALSSCEVVYVALDVVTSDDGTSDLGPLNALIDVVRPQLREGATMVVLSQVPPGFTRSLAARLANEPQPPLVHCQVETLIFGRAVERALHPERFIVGAADPSQPLSEALIRVLRVFNCPILPMRFESAELAKISINLFLVSSISTTNMVAEICERVGADWSEIGPALRLDERIGPKAYLDPGLGIGGGNLGRDLATIKTISSVEGTDTRIVDAWRANSAYRRDWALRLLHAELYAHKADAHLAVWGLAYKHHTTSTKNSPAVALLESIGGRPASAYDPAVSLPEALRGRVRAASDAVAACVDADALVVMTPWPEFRGVGLERVADVMRGRMLIDPYGALDAAAAARAGLSYRRLGVSAAGA